MGIHVTICLTGLLLGANHGCITSNRDQSVLQCNANIPVHLLVHPKSVKVMPSAVKVMLTVFWNSQRVLLAHFQKRGEDMNCASYCQVWRSFGMQFAENVQANWQQRYCFIMTMPGPIQSKEPRREFKNYSGNFLNIRLTARSWPPVTSICLVR
jgi:hypothetical protein